MYKNTWDMVLEISHAPFAGRQWGREHQAAWGSGHIPLPDVDVLISVWIIFGQLVSRALMVWALFCIYVLIFLKSILKN